MVDLDGELDHLLLPKGENSLSDGRFVHAQLPCYISVGKTSVPLQQGDNLGVDSIQWHDTYFRFAEMQSRQTYITFPYTYIVSILQDQSVSLQEYAETQSGMPKRPSR